MNTRTDEGEIRAEMVSLQYIVLIAFEHCSVILSENTVQF